MKKLILNTYANSLPESIFTTLLKDFLSRHDIVNQADEYQVKLFEFIDSLPNTFSIRDFLDESADGICAYVLKIWTLSLYKNERTFLALESILLVAPDDRIVLDGYLFDKSELIQVINAGRAISTNPYIELENHGLSADDTVPAILTEQALTQMRSDSVIGPVIANKEAEQRLAEANISPETITNVISMLTDINIAMSSGGTESEKLANASAAIDRFIGYKCMLTASVENSLNEFIIKCPLRGGGEQNMKFQDALMGGSEANPCIVVTQIFLWNFAKHFRPELMIPERVLAMADRSHFALRDDLALGHESESSLVLHFSVLRTEPGRHVIFLPARGDALELSMLQFITGVIQTGLLIEDDSAAPSFLNQHPRQL